MLLDDGDFCNLFEQGGTWEVGHGASTFDDLEHIRYCIKFLNLFYDVTLRVSGSNLSTANVFFEELHKITRHIIKYTTSRKSLLMEVTSKMK